MYLDYDTYFEYHDQTYIIIEKVANYYGIELKELRWKHYKDYMIDVENVDIIPYSFGDVSRKIFSGNIIRFLINAEFPIIQQWLKEGKISQYFMNLHIIFLI